MNFSLKIKSLVILSLFCLIMGAAHASGEPKSQTALVYESLAGDFSDIKLSILDNHTFTLEMFLMEDDELIVMAGTWSAEENAYQLSFTKNKPIIRALFSKEMILNDTTFKVSAESNTVWIWGTLCSQLPPPNQVAQN